MMTLDNVLIKFKTNMADQRMDMFVHSPAPARKGKVPFAQACTGWRLRQITVCVLESFCVDSEKRHENVSLDAK